MSDISIIVPVYKVEKYIHRCVDSILAQTYSDFELILVDDGSPDNCPTICDAYAEKDNRVHVIHQANGGLSAARNAGIDWAFANSDSQWLTFIDSDDWVHPEYLERLLDAAVTNDVSVSICGYKETEGEEPIINAKDLTPVLWNPEDFYVEHNVNATIACGKLYQKKCFTEIRYPVEKIHEDEFVTHIVLFPTGQMAVMKATLYYYFINKQGITKTNWKPQRLQGLEATRLQIEFMRSQGFKKAYPHAIKKYTVCLSNHVAALSEKKGSFYLKYIAGLRWKLRWMLWKHHSLLPLECFPAVYESAFPCFMYIFWIVRAQIRKIRKKFR